MSVESILDKIVTGNEGVLAGLALSEDRVWHNLEEPYDEIDAEALAEQVSDLFSVTEAVEDELGSFDDLKLDYDSHSVIAKRIEGGIVVLIAEPAQKARYRKVQVNLRLYAKPLSKALAEEPDEEEDLAPPPPTRPMMPPPPMFEAGPNFDAMPPRPAAPPPPRPTMPPPLVAERPEPIAPPPLVAERPAPISPPPAAADPHDEAVFDEPEEDPVAEAAPEAEPKPEAGKRRRVYRGIVFYD